MEFSPGEIRALIAHGLMAFPVTDFDSENRFDAKGYGARLDWLSHYKKTGIFAAAAAGEFFSLTPDEYGAVLSVAVAARQTGIPIFGTAGYGTATAIAFARETEARGADGLLLLPPYLTETSASGMYEHVVAVCRSTRLGVILYNRGNGRIDAATLLRACEACPNLVALKDGAGDIEELVRMRAALGDRLTFINGMPTAEIYAPAYRALGIAAYSSAIFNFAPGAALAYSRDILDGEPRRQEQFVRDFLMPYARMRRREAGYTVSLAKAGTRIVGRGAGPVRPPISDITAEEYEQLAQLIALLGSE